MRANILVVDDDLKVLEILEKNLNNQGYHVQVASDGKSALSSYDDSMPDMVVLDLMLPDMDGRDVVKKIRSTAEGKEVPVLFLSANSDLEVRLSGLDVGAEDFLVKPFSLREFNSKVEKVLARFARTMTLQEKKSALEAEVTRGKEDYLEINKELQRQLLSMKTLFSISQDLNRLLDTEELINVFALTLVGELRISSVALFALKDDKCAEFTLHGLKGFEKKRFSHLKLERNSKFAKWLRNQQKPRKIVRSNDKGWVKKLPDLRLAVFEYVTPVIVKRELKGIVFTGPKFNSREYSPYDLDILMTICNSVGFGMENSRLFKQLHNTYLSTVKALVSIIEAKDPYTKGHTERVADYAVATAEKMSLSKEEQRAIAFGAVLHDIGKLGVYETVLNKPGSLSADEWKILRGHPEVGAGIIENMEFLSATVPLVRHHHENFDGSGYPDGLQGEAIPVGARIIAVADSFDAMTTDRSYRKALRWGEALHTLRSKAGTQFDPNVVESFIELLEKDGFRPRKFNTPGEA